MCLHFYYYKCLFQKFSSKILNYFIFAINRRKSEKEAFLDFQILTEKIKENMHFCAKAWVKEI